MKYMMLLATVLALTLCGCRRTEQTEVPLRDISGKAPTSEHQVPVTETTPSDDPEQTQPETRKPLLYCQVESPEEAEEIAALYGLELLSSEGNYVTFWTEADPKEVIRLGQENGWPELYLNHTAQLY